MKVILIDEVRGLGGRGDVVQVKDGYARNFLLPKNLAREATPGNLKTAEQEKKKWSLLTQKEKNDAQEIASKIEGLKVTIRKRAGEEGTLFGSVTSSEIAEELHKQGYEVDRRRIELSRPIKSLGNHDVEIHLHREVAVHLNVEVLPLSEGEA